MRSFSPSACVRHARPVFYKLGADSGFPRVSADKDERLLYGLSFP